MKCPRIIPLLLLLAGCQPPPTAANSAPDHSLTLPDATTADVGPDHSAVDINRPAMDSAPKTGLFGRQHPDDVRLVSYNIYMDSVFKAGSEPAARFARLVKVLDADIWALQEVYNTSAAEVAALFDKLVPLGSGRRWQVRWGGDSMTVTRHPVTLHHSQPVPSCGRKVSLDLVDLPDSTYARDIYLLNNHFRCCGGVANDTVRQLEADQLVAWMRDARAAGGSITLPQGTPMVVIGDLNTVGGPQPLKTLLQGDIVNESQFGKDSSPDWDGTPLTDVRPLHNTAGPADYTWRWDGSGYDPNRLDYVIYTDSVAQVGARFVLNTVTMTPQQLKAAGLEAGDVLHYGTSDGQYAFDHLPVVVDLRLAKK